MSQHENPILHFSLLRGQMKKLDRLLITAIEFREYKMRPAKLVLKDLIEKNNDALVLFYVFSFADCL